MRRYGVTAALAAMLMLTAAAPAAAGDQRPMSGGFTVGVVPTEPRCAQLTIGFAGSGIATHLGRFTGTGTNCTTFDLATQAVPVFDGSATFIAADRSTITTRYEGTQAAPVGGVATTTTTHTVVGGTGRFADAAGVWESTGTIDFLTGTATATLSGWLSY
jgi:hypothetical protein